MVLRQHCLVSTRARSCVFMIHGPFRNTSFFNFQELFERIYLQHAFTNVNNKRSRDHKQTKKITRQKRKSPLLQKWIELGHVSQVANFWFSSQNFGEVPVTCNSKISIFCMGRTWPPHTKLSLILEILKNKNQLYPAVIKVVSVISGDFVVT